MHVDLLARLIGWDEVYVFVGVNKSEPHPSSLAPTYRQGRSLRSRSDGFVRTLCRGGSSRLTVGTRTTFTRR